MRPSSIQMHYVIIMYVEVQSNLELLSQNQLKTAAKTIHSEIVQIQHTLFWPKTLEPNKYAIPEYFNVFLKTKRKIPFLQKSRVRYSLAQNIHKVANG